MLALLALATLNLACAISEGITLPLDFTEHHPTSTLSKRLEEESPTLTLSSGYYMTTLLVGSSLQPMTFVMDVEN